MIKWLISGLIAAALSASVLAQPVASDLAPDALAKKVTDDVLVVIRADKDIQAGNRKKLVELVEAKVLPHFDFTRMTRLAVGAPWRQASAVQQQKLTDEFRTLLVNTYTSAFAQYRNQTIEYRPLKMQPTDTEVAVRSVIKQSNGGEPVDITYSMEKTDSGWKVYDVIVAGVSLVQNYRSSFSSEIQKGGLDGLTATLAAKNKSLQSQPVTK